MLHQFYVSYFRIQICGLAFCRWGLHWLLRQFFLNSPNDRLYLKSHHDLFISILSEIMNNESFSYISSLFKKESLSK
jgi:hypothetical protein